MSSPTTAQSLFDTLRQRLDLRWEAGQRGAARALQPTADAATDLQRRPSLVGYLNVIHANRVQIVGFEELSYLDGLDPRQRWETIAKIMTRKPCALLIANRRAAPDDLREACNESGTALWVSGRRGHELLNYLQYHLARVIARRATVHGVFLEVYSVGVLITGESGTGKSELALELVSRGHRLVADDAPEFTLVEPDVVDGTCPPVLQDYLEVRGLGLLDIRQMFGDSAVKRNKYLRLVIHLQPLHALSEDQSDRLHGSATTRNILDVDIPAITVPVAPGRNLAVLVEAAVRNFLLKQKGMDATARFIERQAQLMRSDVLW